MKVLHINRNYITSPLHQVMMRNLVDIGVDGTVFAPTDDTSLSEIVPDKNVVVSECFNRIDRFFFRIKQSKIFNAVVSSCNVKEFDLIHAYTLFTDGNCAMKLSERYGVPYIVAVRNTDVNTFFEKMPHLRRIGVEIMLKASAVCFLAQTYRDFVIGRYVPERFREAVMEKSVVIPNGVDDFWLDGPEMQHSVPEKGKKLRLLYAGRIDRNKNILTTVKAMDILNQRGYDAQLTVVGRVFDKGVFRKLSRAERVIILPQCNKEKLSDIYLENDIFVMPSFTESFGLVYVEALSRGLPVVYSAGQGFDGQFKEGEVGRHADSGSPSSVADAITAVLSDYSRISSEAPEKARRFSWRDISKRYARLYIDATERKTVYDSGDMGRHVETK